MLNKLNSLQRNLILLLLYDEILGLATLKLKDHLLGSARSGTLYCPSKSKALLSIVSDIKRHGFERSEWHVCCCSDEKFEQVPKDADS